MGRLHLLPGTTFSNEQDRGEYDPERHAALSLRELERYIALDIVGSYHQSIHSSLSRPPLAVWHDHEGDIPLRLPEDRLQFWVNFLSDQERTLRPTGIHLFDMRYWSAALSADVRRTNRRLLVKYDPRDMLANLTPADVYHGRGEKILKMREEIKKQTIRKGRLQHQAAAA
ncbi:Mu transposase C-terminal domain-containing protein [Shimia aestuarii]|uniref:Mu transposase, C-terminal n=1 Tax=Shimia aestuarii TaxID=254406 RepID=A0A1I4SJB4_9RHOB|nr:Mu transposase C-terminal domain-containing protein [Shimia aestuarii]SFM64586.1 Mu transposase, C-terminal [Shimia aestuarii]